MTSPILPCECGERFHVSPGDVGRMLKCRCGRLLTVDAEAVRAAEPPSPGISGARRMKRKVRRTRSDSVPDGVPPVVVRQGRPSVIELFRLRMRARRHRLRAQGNRRTLARRRALRRAVEIASWAYLALVVLALIVLWGFGDRDLLGTLFLFAGRWLVLLPLLVLLPAALWLRPPALAPLGLATVLALFPLMGLHLGLGALVTRGTPTLRLVTFNVNGGEAVAPRLERAIAEWHADVVALEECMEPIHAAAQHVQGFHADVQAGQGICLLSRWPIASRTVMDRSAFERTLQDGVGGSAIAVRYVVAAPDGPIPVAVVHLETPRKGLERFSTLDFSRLDANTIERDVESDVVRRWVGDSTLVVGDFNMPSESHIYRAHWSDLGDAFAEAGHGFGYTRFNGWIRVRIDHVLHDADWRTLRAVVAPDEGSDHRPLVVDLERKSP